jgi:hypothetical protein
MVILIKSVKGASHFVKLNKALNFVNNSAMVDGGERILR